MTRRARHSPGAFSLIELLASIAILTIIVSALASIFTDSSATWRLGNKKVESNITGRSAIELMARELSGAAFFGVSNPIAPSLELWSDKDVFIGSGGPESDRLAFMTLEHTPQTPSSFLQRDFKQVLYRVTTNSLKPGTYTLVSHFLRSRNDSDFDAITNAFWWGNFINKAMTPDNSGVIAENVRNFEVFVANSNGEVIANYNSYSNGPPLYVDLYLEVLAEEDAQKAALLPPNDPFTIKATRRYQTRVYFNNRMGYAALNEK